MTKSSAFPQILLRNKFILCPVCRKTLFCLVSDGVKCFSIFSIFSDYLAEFIRELRKEQYGDALDKYFRLGKNLNQRDTIAVRKMVGGLVKLIYPDGEYSKEEIEEIIRFALEMRRRVKEQLKKLGGMEFYDVNFSYIDNDTFEEH